ncbi:urease accessory protein UreF [Brevibacillus ruminantium]|uniref:Urease accessory protein UreF n=1 Tax=Brevibacillus ruminantium TaxID=2950604 RepID=A0ABY4WGR4_9BACL|nr:urease accessory protein UreF [Brevibacillus ruminantium]USG65035.1 urease accessory protein UreF [Brevibacillus ruminantium]
MDEYVLSLLQLCDSNFPTGAFSHSFGLETYIQDDKVTNKQTFAQWLEVYIKEQLTPIDGLACRLAYEALKQNEPEKVWKLDRLLYVQNLPRETREGSSRIGVRMAELGAKLYPSSPLVSYLERIRSGQSKGHPALVFAMLAHHLQIPLSVAVLSFLYSSTASLIQNGVRGIPLGQTEGQQLFRELQTHLQSAQKTIQRLDLDDFGAVSPGLELAQMRHERLHIRLFMS